MIVALVTDWPSTLLALGTLGGLAAGAFLSWRARSSDAWRETAEAYEKELALANGKVARLEEVDQERAVSVLALENQIDDLKTRDQAAVLSKLGDVTQAQELHETNAQARADRTHVLQEKTLEVLERVASTLEQTGGNA